MKIKNLFSEEICLPQQHLYRKIHKYISDNYGKISTVLKKEYWYLPLITVHNSFASCIEKNSFSPHKKLSKKRQNINP